MQAVTASDLRFSPNEIVLDHGVNGASQVPLGVKNLPANIGDMRHGFDPWVGKIPWRRARQPAPVFLPGESHGVGWRIPWTEESGGLQFMGAQRDRHD